MRWIWVIFFPLFAGAGANVDSAIGGAFPFAVNNSPSWAWWSDGSALSSPCWCKC